MLDDFFIRAIVAGAGIAMVAAPLGCFIVWRRMAYFGDTLAHSALLGVVLALLLQTDITITVFVSAGFLALLLMALRQRVRLSSDSLLGILSHSALALGLVALAFVYWIQVDLTGLLFGDILSVSAFDIATIYIGGAGVLLILLYIWRPLFAATVSPDLALAEGLAPGRAEAIFVLLTAGVIAIAMKLVGVLLITALLIIPAAAARAFSNGPEWMAVIAALIGVSSVVGGMYTSLAWDTPSGPSIVVVAFVVFLFSLSPLSAPLRGILSSSARNQPQSSGDQTT